MRIVLAAGVAGILSASAAAEMRITEYMYSGAGGEYIEFTNVGDMPIDMTGWSYDDESQLPGTFDLSGFGMVMPGQSVVITEDEAATFRADWGLGKECAVLGLVKNNLGRNDQINLYDASDMLVDQLTYGDEDFPGTIRAQNISGWVQAYGIGMNDPFSLVFSAAGDVQGSVASTNGDVGSPCSHVIVNDVRLSEIRIDQPSADDDEYVELRADAGVVLDGLTVIVIGDGTGGSGVIEAVVPLTGTVPADGIFLVVEDTHTLAPMAEWDQVASLNFENSDNVTFVVVDGFTGATGDDLDTDDDCTLDSTPWANEYDRVALIEEQNPPVGTECHYGSVTVGPDGSFVPGHAFRCVPTGAWTIGAFDPVGGDDTPGVANAACPPPDCLEKDLRLNEIRADQPGSDDDEYIEIVGPAGTSLDGVCIVIVGDAGSTDLCGNVDDVIDLSGNVIPADGNFFVAEDGDTFGETADLITSIGMENGDNLSFFLVCGCDNVIVDGDLDADDDGTIDAVPWLVEYDSVSLFGADGVECTYGAAIVDGGATVPGHVLRCLDGTEWGLGELDPLAGDDTPGLANTDCVVEDTCPADFDDSGDVGISDLLDLLAAWGTDGTGADLADPTDVVDIADLLALLAAWGPCP